METFIIAYAIVWASVIAYTVRLGVWQRRLLRKRETQSIGHGLSQRPDAL